MITVQQVYWVVGQSGVVSNTLEVGTITAILFKVTGVNILGRTQVSGAIVVS